MRVAPPLIPARTGGCRRGKRRTEVPLPDDVAEIVVDGVHVVRATGHERHRNEQCHAARRRARSETEHAARLVVELRRPLQSEAWRRHRLHRNLVVVADPRRALRIGQRRRPLRTAAADLCEREAPGERARDADDHQTLGAHFAPPAHRCT
jgi:hypothetical protein